MLGSALAFSCVVPAGRESHASAAIDSTKETATTALRSKQREFGFNVISILLRLPLERESIAFARDSSSSKGMPSYAVSARARNPPALASHITASVVVDVMND